MSQLHVGIAVADVTPPLGVAMAGYGARVEPAQSVETPLTVHALVVEAGGVCAAMAMTDLVAVSPPTVQSVRETVSAATEIPFDAIMVCGSHTHWGPEVRAQDYMPRHLKEQVLPEYIDCLTRTIAGAIVEAWRERVPTRAGWGSAIADGISFSRRPVGPDGMAAMNLRLPPEQAVIASAAGSQLQSAWTRAGHMGPRLSQPLPRLTGEGGEHALRAGITDPEVPLLKLLTAEGAPLCGLVNFACHPVCGGEDNFYAISPDYPFRAREAFEAVVGAPLAFSLGCAGDQVPTWRGADSRVRVGRSLGAAAARVWYEIEDCLSEASVATARREITLALRDLPTVEEARKALKACEDAEGPGAAFQRNQLSLAERYEGKDGIETQLWALRIGDWAAVGLPGEVFAEIGLQIKQKSPFAVTSIITLCNDSIGYTSTANAHREGGYEPAWSTPGPEAERQMVDAAVELLTDIC